MDLIVKTGNKTEKKGTKLPKASKKKGETELDILQRIERKLDLLLETKEGGRK